MADVIDAVVRELPEPALRKVLERTVREFELAAEKVAAHDAAPTSFPMPDDAGSIERILATRYRALPAAKRTAAASKAAKLLKAPGRAGALGLAGVELGKPTPIEKQVQALPRPAGLTVTKAQLLALAPAAATAAAAPPAIAATATKMTKVELRIHKVRAVDETGTGFEFGDDEIDLSGTTVDESGDTHKVKPFRVGSFDDGDQKVFSPPRRFTFFNLTEGTAFPKSYFVTLVLAEIDQGGLPDFITKLLSKVKERVIAALTAALGGLIGASGGPVGIAIGIAVGWAVGKVWELFGRIWGDDVFPPVTIRNTVSSLTGRWPGGRTDSPERTVDFRGHGGHYTLTYDWRLLT